MLSQLFLSEVRRIERVYIGHIGACKFVLAFNYVPRHEEVTIV
jgi:hypothetical protein